MSEGVVTSVSAHTIRVGDQVSIAGFWRPVTNLILTQEGGRTVVHSQGAFRLLPGHRLTVIRPLVSPLAPAKSRRS
jgi:hypothetical protein